MRGQKPTEKDRLAVYNTGVNVLIAGAIVLVIGVMFQFFGAEIASRISPMADVPPWMQYFAWVFWLAPTCYLISAPTLGVGAFLLYRAYRKVHPKDKQQTRLTSYE